MSGYTGLSGSELSEAMHGAMEAAVRKTAKRVEVTAKKYAPVRKIFQEKGAARMEERTFVDEGLPKSLRKHGSKPTRKVMTMTVRSHRANRMSTSANARQEFVIVSHAQAHDSKIVRTREGSIRVETLKPNVIEVYQPFPDTKPVYAMFQETGGRKLSARGRHELQKAVTGYAASVEEETNVTPTARTIREPYQPGKLGGYPRGTRVIRKKDGTLEARFERVTMRQTVIRVRAEKSIRQIVMKAGKRRRGEAMPHWSGTPLRKSKPTKANPKGQWKRGSRKATPTQVERWKAFQKKVTAAKKARSTRDDTFGGLNSRKFAAEMTPFQRPYGSFKGAQLGTHFNLQVGGHLRESIRVEEKSDKAKVSVSTNVYYAIYQEFGTSHHPAHPFLRPALYENRELLMSAAKDKARRALQGAGKG